MAALLQHWHIFSLQIGRNIYNWQIARRRKKKNPKEFSKYLEMKFQDAKYNFVICFVFMNACD